MTTYVAYLRVSTDEQGRSGLGLEAQQAAINGFLRPGDRLLKPPFVEVESGKKDERPQLQAAIALCRKTGATLLIAKLDRLARKVAFIANLLDSGVEFTAVDMPNANRFTVHIMAAMAEHEREMISTRTKAALQAAKARGVKLGGDRGYRPEQAPDAALASVARKAKADRAAHSVMPVIEELREQGITSLNGLAAALNERGIQTPRGGSWTATAVKRAVERTA
ncbi:MAG TPA: recombinase family protein [Azospirillum sp.]|nr:recombinase family protein [Azospirillum sp.]